MAKQLRRFTDEQVERANAVDVVEYARSQGLELKKSGAWYKAKNQGGLYFHSNGNTWHWHTEDVGGRGAISLCMKLENKTWVEAVKTLLNEEMESIRHSSEWKPEPEQPKEFKLPEKNNTYQHIFAYLTKTRGIDSELVKEMVKKEYIYENVQRSCVFVGRDKEGNARHASVRSTNTIGKKFKQDVAGSKKEFSFSISGKSDVLNVFEAPIDVLSYMSLQKMYGKQQNDSYISLGGVTDKALIRYLSDNKNIKRIRVCTDNDQAGNKAAKRIWEEYGKQYKVTRHRPEHKDFNEDLVACQEKNRDIKKEMDTLKQAGIGEKTIQWYFDKEERIPLKNPDFNINGSCEMLIITDSPREIFSYIDIQINLFKTSFGEDFIPDEFYLPYTNISRLDTYLELHPNITKLWICTSRTEKGNQIAEEITQVYKDKMFCERVKPQLDRWAEDLAQQNALKEPLKEVLEEEFSQMDRAAGLEM